MQGAGLTAVLAMVGASDATSLAVERVRREAPISASHMVEAGAAHGDIWVQTSDPAALLATVWQEAKRGYVIDTTRWLMTTVSTVVCRLVLSVLSVLPFQGEMVLLAPKQACAASSCRRSRLLRAMWRPQPMKAGCMGGTLCLSCWMVVWDLVRSRSTMLKLVPLLLATGKIWRRPMALRSAAGCKCNARVRGLPPSSRYPPPFMYLPCPLVWCEIWCEIYSA